MKTFEMYVEENKNINDSKEISKILIKMDFKHSEKTSVVDTYSPEDDERKYLSDRRTKFKTLFVNNLYKSDL
jgi:hypothetical protein